MRRSDKEIKKRVLKELDCEIEGFDAWAERNAARLSGFENPKTDEAVQANGTKARAIPRFAWLLVVLAVVAVCIAVGLIFGLGSPKKVVPDMTFGSDDEYIYRFMTQEETERHLSEYPMLGKLFEVTEQKQLTEADGAMAYAIFNGDFEASDYYIIEIRIVYNDDVGFHEKRSYEGLTEHAETATYSVQYRYAGIQVHGLFAYYMQLQPKSEGRKIYIRVWSFDNDIDYFINNFLD